MLDTEPRGSQLCGCGEWQHISCASLGCLMAGRCPAGTTLDPGCVSFARPLTSGEFALQNLAALCVLPAAGDRNWLGTAPGDTWWAAISSGLAP